MFRIAEEARKSGFEVWTYSPFPHPRELNRKFIGNEYHFFYGTKLERYVSLVLGHIFGFNGLSMRRGTKKMIKDMKSKHIEIIHLHNLHNYCIYFPILIKYVKKYNIKVVWTLHDCWSFTGQCPYFTVSKCDKWRYGCNHCHSHHKYPQSYADCSKLMWKLKRFWFTSIKNMTIVTPSKWLADLVKLSFLKGYPIKVIYNGIDLNIFKSGSKEFLSKYNISPNKTILLGVAFDWGYRKGLDVFIELCRRLNPEQYQIVLVGTNDSVEAQLPDNIISIERTYSQVELVDIYSSSDVFVNPTREEVLGLVNIEANACGIPVITFRTGGSPECIDETSGIVVNCDDIDAMERAIVQIRTKKNFLEKDCVNRAKLFDMNDRFKEYVRLYEDIGENE